MMILKDYTCMSVLCITVWTNVACNKENFTQSCFLHVAFQDWDFVETVIYLLAKAWAAVAKKLLKFIFVSAAACLQVFLYYHLLASLN